MKKSTLIVALAAFSLATFNAWATTPASSSVTSKCQPKNPKCPPPPPPPPPPHKSCK